MTTVKEIKDLFSRFEEDFKVSFRKWEHYTEEELNKRKYPMPNRVSLSLLDRTTRIADDGDTIRRTFIFEDDFDNDLIMTKDEAIKFFCDGLDDNDLVTTKLYVEDIPGHYDHIEMKMSKGDTSWSDKQTNLEFDE